MVINQQQGGSVVTEQSLEMRRQTVMNALDARNEIGIERLGAIMVKSGFFKDTRDQAQAVVKILAGQELGLGPIASMRGVYIIEGRTSLSADLIAACIQKSGKYKYRVREWTSNVCRIEFFEGSESLGLGEFTIQEAATAGLTSRSTWKQYPKAMLFARAMSQGARAFCPEIFAGAVYAPEELGAEVDGNGAVVIAAAGHSVNTETGEVVEAEYVPTDTREVEDVDMVRSADEKLWLNWERARSKGLDLGLVVPELRLPMRRAELKAVGSDVLLQIKRREQELVAQEEEVAAG